MTTGWDSRDGTGRLTCASLDPGDISANVFCGLIPYPGSGSAPTVAIGTSDFAVEFWARRKIGNSPGGDADFMSGLVGDDTTSGRVQAGVDFDGNEDDVDCRFDEDFNGLGIAEFFDKSPDVLGLWSHYVVNCDRNANMELFIDVESKGTVSIAAQSSDLGSPEVHPLVVSFTSDIGWDPTQTTFDDWDNIVIMPVIIGPYAVHKRILTTAEMETSYRNKSVQSLGAAVTLLLYDWEIKGETGWDDTPDHLVNGIRIGLGLPFYMPTGTDAKVIDKSGNENHWDLPTAASYDSDTLANQAKLAFGIDKTFT